MIRNLLFYAIIICPHIKIININILQFEREQYKIQANNYTLTFNYNCSFVFSNTIVYG